MSRMKDIYTELEEDEPDMVNHPPHYTSHPSGIECIQITEHMGFCIGNAVKYLWRADEKGNAIEDLEKAAWYIQREITRRCEQQAQLSQMNQTIGSLVPAWVSDGMKEMLTQPSPLAKIFDMHCGCRTCSEKDNTRTITVPAVAKPDVEEEEIGVAAMGENWFQHPLPGFGLNPKTDEGAHVSSFDEYRLDRRVQERTEEENEHSYEDQAERLAAEAQRTDSARCINCGQKVFFLEGDHAVTNGHIYSRPGLKEVGISGLCEFCFDRITQEVEAGKEPEPDEEDPDRSEDPWG